MLNKKIPIGIVTCMWQRHKVFCAFAEGVKRLQSLYNITTVVVGSEGKVSKNLAEGYGFKYIEHPNAPLGAKFNAGLLALKEMNIDYVMVMGSDDIVSSSLIEKYLDPMTRRIDIIGILDFYVYSLEDKKLYYWSGYGKKRHGEPIGLGRCISRRVLNNLNWKLWDDTINKSLDYNMWKKIEKFKSYIIKIKTTKVFAVDIKGGVCMTKIGKLKMKEVNLNIMKRNIGKKELSLIFKT